MTYTVLDFETTGLNHLTDQVIEMAAVKLDKYFKEIGSFHTLVRLRFDRELPEFITKLTGITEDDLLDGMRESEAFEALSNFIGDSVVVAQYAPFDVAFLEEWGIEVDDFICTKTLSSMAEPDESSSLKDVCERLGIKLDSAHRALDDTRATAEVLRFRANEGILNFNVLCISPDRPLRYIPGATEAILLKGGGVLLDYTLNREDN